MLRNQTQTSYYYITTQSINHLIPRINPPPKNPNPINRKHPEHKRHHLLPSGLNDPRHRAPPQHHGRKQPDLLAQRLARAQPQIAIQVQCADGNARADRGDRARARVADDAAQRGEEGEREGGVGG